MSKQLPYRIMSPKAKAAALEKFGYVTVYEAVDSGNMEGLKFLLEARANPLKCFRGESPMMLAVRKREFEAVRLLYRYGAPLETRDQGGNTALAVAVRAGDMEMARLLLEFGSKVSAKNKVGSSVLMIAAANGDTEMVEFLLERGAAVNKGRTENVRIRSALFDAILGGYIRIVRLLVGCGADLYERNREGVTPLMMAQAEGNWEIAEYLRALGPDADKLDGDGNTPLMKALKGGELAEASRLIEQGADANARDLHQNTPLMWAARVGDIGIVKLLMLRGADLLSKNEYGTTALCNAAIYGHAQIVELLMSAIERSFGASVASAYMESRDNFGRSVLMWAAKDGRIDIVQLLLEHGAKVNAQNNCKRTPPMLTKFNSADTLSRQRRRTARIETSCERGYTPLMYAARKGRMDVVKLLVERGADVHLVDCFGRTALMWGAWSRFGDFASVVKILLSAGGTGVNARDLEGSSAILFGVHHGHRQVVEYLLDAGADVNDMNDHGFTPLMQAAKNGSIKLAGLLISRGAEINMEEEFGRSALFFAVERGNIYLVRFLLRRGADLNVKDEYTRESALEIAKKNNYTKIVELLIKYGAKE